MASESRQKRGGQVGSTPQSEHACRCCYRKRYISPDTKTPLNLSGIF
jgi:hypothetical protein